MAEKVDYIWIYHRDKTVKTISDLTDREYIYQKPDDLFKENVELIFSQMTLSDKIKFSKDNRITADLKPSDLKSSMILPVPCKLRIDSKNVNKILAISQTNLQEETSDYYAFADERIQEIIQNPGYQATNYVKKNVDCLVFGWFKSLYYVGEENNSTIRIAKEFTTEFYNLSKYIFSLSTLVTQTGGSFTLKLPILPMKSGNSILGRKIELDESAIYEFENQYYSKVDFSRIESDFFSNLISNNDLLFISFEKLDMEFKREANIQNDNIDNFGLTTKISGNVYDMIGLVDDVKVVTNSRTAEAHIEVTGRDLMKLLIEDGSFFFNNSTVFDPSTIFCNLENIGAQGDIKEANFLNASQKSNPSDRIRWISGEIDVFTNRINMDIAYVLKGVLSKLANVEVVPSYVFDSWGNERTKFNDFIEK